MTRRYGQWAGNENGVPEDTSRCVAETFPDHYWPGRQCTRRRGHGPGGLYCRQHARIAERRLARKEET